MSSAVAIDIGASGARVGLVGVDGVLGSVRRCRLGPALSREEVVRRIRGLVEALPGGDAVVAGVSFPAFLDGSGRVRSCVNLPGLEGADLREELAPLLGGLPVFPIPDVSAAALAEARLGAGRGVGRFLCVVLGSGVNAGLTERGRVVDLTFGCLGDAGHVVVAPGGPRCPCGGLGHLEAICSGIGLARAARPLGLSDVRGVARAIGRGDPAARRLVRAAGRALGRAIATWVAMLAPDAVALTGGLAGALGGALLDAAGRELARTGAPHVTARLELRLGRLLGSAALVGAGLAALDRDRRGRGGKGRRTA